mmetsp:Transcript_46535/g.75955  ORF Transcript_46535/g.75955 Transcript_46535/m.75955 type:complete len:105 (-) Transcript_46535:1255-1569(-)
MECTHPKTRDAPIAARGLGITHENTENKQDLKINSSHGNTANRVHRNFLNKPPSPSVTLVGTGFNFQERLNETHGKTSPKNIINCVLMHSHPDGGMETLPNVRP